MTALFRFFSAVFNNSDDWQHACRVKILVDKISENFGLPTKIKADLSLAAQYHDIGKIYQNSYYDHPDDSYFLFLRLLGNHSAAELIRHHHCYPVAYQKRYNELNKGYPHETCRILNCLSPELQLLQLCNEWDSLDSQGKSAYHEISYLAELHRWDKPIVKKFLALL